MPRAASRRPLIPLLVVSSIRVDARNPPTDRRSPVREDGRDARNHIVNRETVALLIWGGASFERRMLRTPDEARGDLAALDASLATVDPSPTRRESLEALSAAVDRPAARIRARRAVPPVESTTG